MQNKISDLRNHLFEQLERLKDPECKLEDELKKARAISDISAVIIESAKVEVDFIKATNGEGTGFINEERRLKAS